MALIDTTCAHALAGSHWFEGFEVKLRRSATPVEVPDTFDLSLEQLTDVSAALGVSSDKTFIAKRCFISFTTLSSCEFAPTMTRSSTCSTMYTSGVWFAKIVGFASDRVTSYCGVRMCARCSWKSRDASLKLFSTLFKIPTVSAQS